jgi:lipoate synthase
MKKSTAAYMILGHVCWRFLTFWRCDYQSRSIDLEEEKKNLQKKVLGISRISKIVDHK